jgi:hypothetical protein
MLRFVGPAPSSRREPLAKRQMNPPGVLMPVAMQTQVGCRLSIAEDKAGAVMNGARLGGRCHSILRKR